MTQTSRPIDLPARADERVQLAPEGLRENYKCRHPGLMLGCPAEWLAGVGEGVCELRIGYRPGYRVYYAQDGKALILLLCGGDKRTRAKDIKQAHEYWKDYKARKPKPPVPSGRPSAKRGRGRRLH